MVVLNLEVIVGVIAVIVGFGLLLNKQKFLGMYDEMQKLAVMVYLSGFLSLIIGLVILSELGSLWVEGLKGIILSVIGWLSLLKGVILILFPKIALQFVELRARKATILVSGVILIVIGLVLLFM